MDPKKLPIYELRTELTEALKTENRLIIEAPTGSGKSIALPYLLKNSGLVGGKIFVAQPRRIAARLLSKTLAKMVNWTEGNEVGYQVRFDKKYCKMKKPNMRTIQIGQRPLPANEPFWSRWQASAMLIMQFLSTFGCEMP